MNKKPKVRCIVYAFSSPKYGIVGYDNEFRTIYKALNIAHDIKY